MVAAHGHSKYTNDGCRCAECRRANTEYQRVVRARLRARLAADGSVAQHGRASTYVNWGCRCVECRAAHAARLRVGGAA